LRANEHSIQFVVEPDAIDELGHVNNAVYLQYAERAARSHTDRVGFTVDRMLADNAVPVIRRQTIVYHLEARVGDVLTVFTRAERLKGVRGMRHTRILRDETLLEEVDTEWVWIEPETRRPVRIPQAVLEAFGEAAPQ